MELALGLGSGRGTAAEAGTTGVACWRYLARVEAAKERYLLRPADLEGLACALDTNPVDASFAPMKLYRRVDLASAAVKRWGSRENLERERRKRLLR